MPKVEKFEEKPILSEKPGKKSKRQIEPELSLLEEVESMQAHINAEAVDVSHSVKVLSYLQCPS